MAHSKQVQEKFVELRGQGLSFDKISSLIDVSKPTLVKWQKELWSEVQAEEAVQYQALLEMHKLSKRNKVESHCVLLSKIMEEIGKRDLSGESIKDLLTIKTNCEESIARDLKDTKFAWKDSKYILDEELTIDQWTTLSVE